MTISNAAVVLESNAGVGSDFPQYQVLTVTPPGSAGAGLILQPSGGGGTLNIQTLGAVAALNALTPAGILCVTTAAAGSTSAVLGTRLITADASIAISNAGGVAGNILLSVNDNTSLQQVQVLNNGSSTSPNVLLPRTQLNFIPSTGMGIDIFDDGTKINLTFTSTGGGGGGGVSSVTATAPVLSSGGTTPVISLATSSAAGSYTNANITVDSVGRVTVASNGSSSGGVSQIIAGTNVTISPSGGTGTVTINATGGGGGGLTSVGITDSGGGSFLTITNSPLTANGVINLAIGTLAVANGGTGVATLTANGILIGEGTSAITSQVLTTGQFLVGVTSSAPVPTTLVAGTGVTIVPGSGTLTINAPGGGSGVSQIIAGTNVTISPSGGTGTVTINATGGGGGAVSSVGQATSDTSIVVAGTGSGPYTGTVTLELNTTLTKAYTIGGITMTGPLNMGNEGIADANQLQFATGATIQNPTTGKLTVATGDGKTGGIYDSYFTPLGGITGTPGVGQVLSLVSNPSGTTGQVVQWIDGGGSSGVASVNHVTGNTDIVVAGTGSGPYTGAVTLALNATLAQNYLFSGDITFGNTTSFNNGTTMGANAITDVGNVQFNPFSNTPTVALTLYQGTEGTPTTNLGLAITDGTSIGQLYDSHFNPPPGGGGGVTSVGQASSDTSILITGTGSGPYTGAVALELNPTLTKSYTFNAGLSVAANQNIVFAAGNGGITGIHSIAFGGGSGGTIVSTNPGLENLLLDNAAIGTGTGAVYDTYLFPIGESHSSPGTAGHQLQLVTPVGVNTAQVVAFNPPTSAMFFALPVSASPVPVISGNAYIVPDNGVNPYTITLPATAALGQQIIIANYNLTNGIVNINTHSPGTQTIIMLNDATGVGITLFEYGATVTLLCIEANTAFGIISSQGQVQFN